VAELAVLYDEGCDFCTRLAARLADRPEITTAPIGSTTSSLMLRDLSPAERYPGGERIRCSPLGQTGETFRDHALAGKPAFAVGNGQVLGAAGVSLLRLAGLLVDTRTVALREL
jgi:hypothetical protein